MLKAPKVGQNCTLFTKLIFSRNVCWTVEKQFWQVWRNKFAKLRDNFCSKPTNVDKFVFVLPIDFTWKYLLETNNAFLIKLPKPFCLILDCFWAKMRKVLNKFVTFPVKLFFIGVYRGHQAMHFSQFCCNDFAEKWSFIGSGQKLIDTL